MKKHVTVVSLLIVAIVFMGCIEIGEKVPFKVSKFEITPDEIKQGGSVNIKITIRNTGKEITPENKYKVGVKITEPSDWKGYWNITEPKLIPKLAPNGPNDSEFRAESKPDSPVGEYTFQPFVVSFDKKEEFVFKNNKKVVQVKSVTAPREGSAFESICVIAVLIAVAYLIRRGRK